MNESVATAQDCCVSRRPRRENGQAQWPKQGQGRAKALGPAAPGTTRLRGEDLGLSGRERSPLGAVGASAFPLSQVSHGRVWSSA